MFSEVNDLVFKVSIKLRNMAESVLAKTKTQSSYYVMRQLYFLVKRFGA